MGSMYASRVLTVVARISVACLCVGGLATPRARAQVEIENEGATYRVSAIQLEATQDTLGAVELQALAQLDVDLGEDPDRLTVPSPNRPTRTLRIADVGREGPVSLDRAAIIEICTTIVRELQSREQISRCRPHPDDIASGEDVREGRDALRLQIKLARVRELRTFATGSRRLEAGTQPLNNPVHRALRDRAPLATSLPAVGAATTAQGFPLVEQRVETPPLLDIAQLEEYAARLSRHPGRTVGLVYSRASTRDASLAVDLVVTENKPWAVYLQSTNAGTDSTGRYRSRVGFTNTQLTGNDDVLQLEYLTSDFDEIQAASASYEAPLPWVENGRYKLFGAMSSFDNEDLGIPDFDGLAVEGTRAEAGLRILANVYQRRRFFVDVSLGLRAETVAVDNGITGVDAKDSLVLPSIGARFEQRTPFWGIAGGLELEWNLAGLAGTDAGATNAQGFRDEAGGLGRDDPDDRYKVLRFDVSGSWTIDGWLRELRGAAPAKMPALAHELSVRLAGQYAFDDRLIPQEQGVAGGRDTVRGYDQAIAVGDSVYVGSVEYRYHFPRALRPRPATQLATWLRWAQLGSDRFRYAPEQPGGATDWDLTFKLFADFGRVLQSDRRSLTESHETLVGVGVGMDVQLRENFSLSLDLAFPLEEGDRLDVDRGDPVLHFSGTILY